MDTSTEPAGEIGETASHRFPVVGIGASAGGLDAFILLLRHLPLDTGTAFVLVQHLDPKHQSELPALLACVTRMPLDEARNGTRVEPDHVYVMPHNVSMTISGGVLRLDPRDESVKVHWPIDGFFRSLAESCGRAAIGVVLSGTGSDGTLGLQMIKSEGGITFAQDPQSAESPGMPGRAAASGSVDFVLAPDQIAAELLRIGRHPYLAPGRTVPTPAPHVFDKIYALLGQDTEVDSSVYRQTTVHRRIHRRMAIRGIDTVEEYAACLENQPAELARLHQEILITVTRFFCDPGAFTVLKDSVIPGIVQAVGGDRPIRVWVPGCATGEEAYSIAICLLESLADRSPGGIHIFASDISATAIDKARAGFYSAEVSEDIGPERLGRFFTPVEGGYKVNKEVRELCVFARQDLVRDPPYSHLNLISCRNVLIYLGTAQRKILASFHYALEPGGFLWLGSAETTGAVAHLFTPVDPTHKIYSRKEVPRDVYLAARNASQLPGESAPTRRTGRGTQEPNNQPGWQKQAERILLAKYGPAGVIVDDDLDVLEVRGKVHPYLELSPGTASLNILKMARTSGLMYELRAAIQRARTEARPVRKVAVPVIHSRSGKVTLQVIPFSSEERCRFLVVFEEVLAPSPPDADEQPKTKTPADDPAAFRADLENLKHELAQARYYAATVLEQCQLVHDEDQSGAEEALSNLEELQSINEGLETANEELKSVNEELNSMNQELQTRNTELRQSRDFIQNIVDTVREPLLVLDPDFHVRRANLSFCRFFQVSTKEIQDCLLFDLGNAQWNIPALRTVLEHILRGETALVDYQMESEFANIGRKTLVLNARRLENNSMILLAIEDTTMRRRAEDALQATLRDLESALAERTVLLQEVHHRVKNNLAIISSLLNMEANQTQNSAVKLALDASQQRVQSIALVHEQLYGNAQFDRIDFPAYARQLVQNLQSAMVGDPDRLSIDLNFEAFELSTKQAVPCALILNELLTNSFKYAFPGGRKGRIVASFREFEPGFLELKIEDNGVGLPSDADNRKPQSLGLQIVEILTRQLDGSLGQEPSQGTSIVLRFPARSARRIA